MDASTSPSADLQRRGLMLVISSPSGAGKSTLCRALLAKDAYIGLSVSVTTRPPRAGEVDGQDYFFIDAPEFARMVRDDELLEHATVFQNAYGTPRAYVERQLTAGQDVLFDIDWQGAQQLRQRKREDVVSVFILPPSAAALEARLRDRAQDAAEVVAYRMSQSRDEMSHWLEYDYVIVNEDIEVAEASLTAILTAERLRRERQVGLYGFVQSLSLEASDYRA